jgi:decaprenyl-phosphate phosphoribosyltransferase
MADLPAKNPKEQINLARLVSSIVRVVRPVHWIKNLALFAALVFTGNLYDKILFDQVVIAFLIFNLATSATYIFNDIIDAKSDRLHPIKKKRPIASGTLPVPVAFFLTTVLVATSLLFAEGLNHLFFVMVLVYLLIQIVYSLFLKNLATIDILAIASGFVIRVYAGALVTDAHLSVWFLLCVISAALFLASGKRRAELGVITTATGETRKSLTHYSKPLLDAYVTMFGNAAWLSWALFTFFESPRATLPFWLKLAEISRTTTIDKLLMSTIPVVIFIIMRYESLIFEDRSEAPEKVLLTDKPLMAAIAIWSGLILWILYSGVTNLG